MHIQACAPIFLQSSTEGRRDQGSWLSQDLSLDAQDLGRKQARLSGKCLSPRGWEAETEVSLGLSGQAI